MDVWTYGDYTGSIWRFVEGEEVAAECAMKWPHRIYFLATLVPE
jgi:hypothetical protein